MLYEYKDTNFARGHRVQMLEETFAKGMQFTNSPLTEGYLKTLVNYDIFEAGVSLKPRPGLRTTEAFVPSIAVDSLGTERIVAARERYAGAQSRAQFLLMHSLAAGSSTLRKGTLRMLTDTGTAATTGFTGIPTNTYISESYANANFVVPENAEIHGTVLDNTEVLVRQVGCYAWNGDYYFFDPVLKKLVHTKYDTAASKFIFVAEDTKAITSKEAVLWGYNMLSANPYTFANAEGTAVIVFTGMLPYDAAGNLALTPVVNQSLQFEVFYTLNVGAKYDIKWEWRSSAGDTWTTLKTETITFATTQDLKVSFSPPSEEIVMRVSAYGYTEATVNTYTDATLAVGFGFNKADYGNTANIDTTTYDLTTATGMAYWQNRLVVWGLAAEPTLLFASDVNDPTYFPYPNNCDRFEEPIKYALPFLDKLLVFTGTKLYMLTLSSDGLSWTTTNIQNNLTISDWDIHLIQVVKNMVFFRSGNYYYMIVPKSSSTTGELTLAAISKPLYYFFDHFQTNVNALLSEVYKYGFAPTLIHYYNFLDFEDVHNVYVYQTDTDEYLFFCLLYNTVNRSWRIYTFGSQSILRPYKSDATQKGTLCSLASVTVGGTTEAVPQLLKYSNTVNSDFYIPRDVTVTTADTVFKALHWLYNWQFLDTGYRDHTSNFKKRYREMQFVINNISNQALKFYTDFFIDGEQRKSKYQSVVTQDIDSESATYGLITVEQVLIDPPTIVTPSATILGEAETDTEVWLLDSSMFPELAFWKARFPVSGKGYTPRFYLTCHSEAGYELLNISWVYRTLYSR